MKTIPQCAICFMKQAMLTAQQITGDPAQVFAAIQAAAGRFPELDMERTPPENSRRLISAVMAYLGDDNPFRAAKARCNALALRGYDALRNYVQGAPDPLEAAVRVAAVGNSLDLSIFSEVNIAASLEQAQTTELAINHYARFRQDVTAAGLILILGDNAGEIVFDLPLVELLRHKDVYYGVKSAPISNDVSPEDAAQVGMDRFATVVSIGCAYQGVPLDHCAPEFRALFRRADVIIAKGQGNFETLDDVDANLYFIVKAKCGPTADALGVRIGDVVLLSQQMRRQSTS